MWTEFEWENRVNVNNSMSSVFDPLCFCVIILSFSHIACFFFFFFFRDPRDYLHHVMKSTNMSCLTPEGATSGECDFLSANMYARSLFGEYLFVIWRLWAFSFFLKK